MKQKLSASSLWSFLFLDLASFQSFVSGLISALAFIQPKFSILIWISFTPLVSALLHNEAGKAFQLGYIFGLSFFLGSLYWIPRTINLYGFLPIWLAIFILIIFSLYLSLYPALAAYISKFLSNKNFYFIILFPVSWVASEFLRSHLLTGFPWNLLAASQFQHPLLLQITSITGAYGLSFIIILVNVLIFNIFQKRGMKRLSYFLFLAAIFLILVSFGYLRLNQKILLENTIKASVIQPNISQDQLWDKEARAELMQHNFELTLNCSRAKPDLIIWPESATPIYFRVNHEWQEKIIELVKQTETYLLFGSPDPVFENGKEHLYNSAFLISPEGHLVDFYQKTHLVPFGEYVPLGKYLFFLGNITAEVADFSPGQQIRLIPIPKGNFAVAICYEIAFPHLVRKMANQGAQFLVTITNDAWFGSTAAPTQHFATAVLRAVENGLPVIRSANTGISGFIDQRGRIIQKSGLFQEIILTDEITIQKDPPMTFYARFGDLFAWCCLLLAFILFSYKRVFQK